MQLYARTELDQYHPEAVLSVSKHFVVAYYGWFSFAYLLGEEDTVHAEICSKAKAISVALLQMDA